MMMHVNGILEGRYWPERMYHYREEFPTIGAGLLQAPPLNWSDTPTIPSPDSGLLLFSEIY